MRAGAGEAASCPCHLTLTPSAARWHPNQPHRHCQCTIWQIWNLLNPAKSLATQPVLSSDLLVCELQLTKTRLVRSCLGPRTSSLLLRVRMYSQTLPLNSGWPSADRLHYPITGIEAKGIREGLTRKKCCSFGFCPNERGALSIFFVTLS